MKNMLRLLAIVFCIPMVASLFATKDVCSETYRERIMSEAGFGVRIEEATGSYTYDPEELLPLVVAACVQGEQEEALYQAITVICRTNLLYAWEQEGRPQVLPWEKCGFSLKSMCNDTKPIKRTELDKAVQETLGIVLTYEGQVIPAPFFYMSAGRTRSGREVYGEESYPYLCSVDCSENMTRENFLKLTFYEKEEFYQQLEQITGAYPITSLEDVEINREESGYARSIYCKQNGRTIGTNELCKIFGWCSPCFEWEERERQVVVRTKGIGHGLGFDICYGARLAEQGMNYEELLAYFYSTALPDKRYNAVENLRIR